MPRAWPIKVRRWPNHLFFFAPARVKVKHYDYDPIGTWGKWRLRGHKMWHKELPSILPKRHLGRLKPSAMQWEKLICDLWQFVIPFYQWTSTLARSPASYLCKSNVQQPRLLRCYLGSKEKLVFSKLFRPWWNREEFQSHIESVIHSSHRLRPILAIQPNPTNNWSQHFAL